MLKIRAVVSAGREQHHRRVGDTGGRYVFERLQKLLRIIFHRPHANALEHPRKRPLHRAAVFQDVADARRTTPVVLQHHVLAVLVANQIRSANVDVNILRHVEVHELPPEMARGQNVKFRDDAVLQNFLLVINVVQEQVQGRDALGQAAFQVLPFLRRNDARQQVERKNLLRTLRVAIDVEGDALPEKRVVNRLALGLKFRLGQLREQLLELLVMRARTTLRVRHFIEPVVDLIFRQHMPSVVFLTA